MFFCPLAVSDFIFVFQWNMKRILLHARLVFLKQRHLACTFSQRVGEQRTHHINAGGKRTKWLLCQQSPGSGLITVLIIPYLILAGKGWQ